MRVAVWPLSYSCFLTWPLAAAVAMTRNAGPVKFSCRGKLHANIMLTKRWPFMCSMSGWVGVVVGKWRGAGEEEHKGRIRLDPEEYFFGGATPRTGWTELKLLPRGVSIKQ